MHVCTVLYKESKYRFFVHTYHTYCFFVCRNSTVYKETVRMYIRTVSAYVSFYMHKRVVHIQYNLHQAT